MRVAKFLTAASAVATLSACGGGGSGSVSPAPTPTPTTATLPVTLSSSSADVTIAEGQSATFGFTASYTGSSTQPIVADVKVNGTRYALDGTPTASGTQVAVALKTIPLPPGGKTTSTVSFRLCTSADCATVYPGSAQTFTVNLDVQLKDWATFQRDAAHTGYIAVNYRTADFAPAWSLNNAPYQLSTVASRRGGVYVNLATASGNTITRALNPANGAVLWEYDLGRRSYFSGPAVANGRVMSMAMDISSTNLPLDIIDATDGRYLRSLSYESQFSRGGTPTMIGDEAYYQAGYYGNVVYAGNTATGARAWRTDTTVPGEGYVQEGQSVAADAQNIYYFGGGNLFALSRATGSVVARIRNPHFTMFGLSYFGTYAGGPLLDGAGRVITFTSNRGTQESLPLVAFSIANATTAWRSARAYLGHPAMRQGMIYAIRGGSAIVDIIDPASGSVTASIDLGSDKGQLVGNIILTNSHMFVASETATYAVDLAQANTPVVWSAPQSGALAITPDNLLTISSTSALHAYKLH